MIEHKFFIWLFEEYLYDYIKEGASTFEMVFSNMECVVFLPRRCSVFKWWHEIGETPLPGDLQRYYVKDLVLSETFTMKAMESLRFWGYTCEIGTKDNQGLRFYIKVIKLS